jgi:hypothetical protein
MAQILREFYSLRTPSTQQRIDLASKFTAQLTEWRANLSLLLDHQGVFQSLLLPLFQRQRNVLNLAYWHALLLIHRPFLLSNFANLSNYSTSGANGTKKANAKAFEENAKHCLDAAMQITKIVEELDSNNQLYRVFWVWEL